MDCIRSLSWSENSRFMHGHLHHKKLLLPLSKHHFPLTVFKSTNGQWKNKIRVKYKTYLQYFCRQKKLRILPQSGCHVSCLYPRNVSGMDIMLGGAFATLCRGERELLAGCDMHRVIEMHNYLPPAEYFLSFHMMPYHTE